MRYPRLPSSGRNETVGLILFGVASMVLMWLEFFVVRHRVPLAFASAALSIIIAVAILRRQRDARRIAVAVVAGTGAVSQLLWIATSQYMLFIAALVMTIVLIVALWVIAWSQNRRKRSEHRSALTIVSRATGLVAGCLAVLVSVGMTVVAIDPTPVAVTLQESSASGNSFEPHAPTETRVEKGVQLTSDLQYGSTYPNSYLDVYIADNDPTVDRPTFLVVHGGGFIIGDKATGDPNSPVSESAMFAVNSQPLLESGYNVVAINYGLAPQVPYPVPVKQLGEAIQYLTMHADELGLNMDAVVLSGSSAGGHIVGQYVNIQTDPTYAEEVGIEATINVDVLKAVVLDSAALDASRAGATQLPELSRDLLFDLALRSYIGTSRDTIAQSNIITYASSAWPPAFIADGNTGSFPDQARDLSAKLDAAGVDNELLIPPVRDAVLVHGYMAELSPWRDQYNERKIAFLEKSLTSEETTD